MARKPQNDRHKGTAFTTRLAKPVAEQVKALAVEQQRPYGNMIAVLVAEALKTKEETNGTKK